MHLSFLRRGATTLLVLAISAAACDNTSDPMDPGDPGDPGTPAITVAVNPATVSLEQGQSATTTVTVTRTGGFTGAIAIAASGLPTGVTASSLSIAAGATTGTLTLTAAASASVGSVTATVQGSATGVAGASSNLGVTVTPAPTSGNDISWTFCADTGIPVFVAAQDGSGPWTAVTATSGTTYDLPISGSSGAVAIVTVDSGNPSTTIWHMSRDELELLGANQCTATGTGKTINGTVANLGATDQVGVSLGGSSTFVVGATGGSFQLTNVASGPQDLVAGRSSLNLQNQSFDLNRMIIRRAVDAADGSTLAALDFAAEGFDPATATATLGGVSPGETSAFVVSFSTRAGQFGSFLNAVPQSGTSSTYGGVPTSQMASGDFHQIIGVAADANSVGESRSAAMIFRDVADVTLALGPDLSAPTVAAPSTSPYPLYQVDLGVQSEYDQFWLATLQQGAGSGDVTMIASQGWVGGASTVSMSMPDFSGLAGWMAAWAPSAGVSTTWVVSASGWTGGTSPFILLPTIADGSTYQSATAGGTFTP